MEGQTLLRHIRITNDSRNNDVLVWYTEVSSPRSNPDHYHGEVVRYVTDEHLDGMMRDLLAFVVLLDVTSYVYYDVDHKSKIK